MEDVTDLVFRRICRRLGVRIAVTEFVNVEGLLRGCKNAKRKIALADDDVDTAIQIYGSDPVRLAEAARIAEAANPLYIDINCGCWVPKIAGRGAGAGWLREPAKMVEMTRMVVKSVSLPVTVKTRIGLGPESHMPIVDLAQRLEDAGIAALTIHCRTAQMGHKGEADWTWAARAREKVSIPVIVNGDVRSAADASRALRDTGCAGVMVGRRAIEHPWVFREIEQGFATGSPDTVTLPTMEERIELCKAHLHDNVLTRTERHGVHVTRRHLAGYLHGLPNAAVTRKRLMECDTERECVDVLDAMKESISHAA